MIEYWFVMVKTEDKKWHYSAGIPVKDGKTSEEIKTEANNIMVSERKRYPQYKYKLVNEIFKKEEKK
jgi:hypothetical protein